jgi:aromatic-L-amino-acid/L-tryptophan decarboxylase
MAVLPFELRGAPCMNPLALSAEEYRRAYERILQLAQSYLSEIDQRSCVPGVSGTEATDLFAGPVPEEGMGLHALDDLTKVIEASRVQGPRFFGYVLGSGEPIAAGADLLVSVINQNVTAWRSGPAAVSIEHLVVGWLAQAIGCEGFRGSLTGGGSAANLMALAMARESRLPANDRGIRQVGTVYASEQAHMSIAKAVALLGIGRDHLRLIPCDDRFRLRTDLLQQLISADIRTGKRPIAIVGSAGSVATGSVDPLNDLATIAKDAGAWFHIDGAYGALAAIARPQQFVGMELADSISLDPHKWLYQPLDCGCLLFRDEAQARRTFSFTGDYAKSFQEDPLENFAFFEESLELSRRFRALKLWLSLRYHGIASFRQQIENDLDRAEQLASLIEAEPELELLAPVPLSAVCFRYLAQSVKVNSKQLDELNLRILRKVQQRGRVYLSNATIHGKFALRACIVNHRTTSADIEAVVDEVLKVGRDLSAEAQS